jgi:hypothetical protein
LNGLEPEGRSAEGESGLIPAIGRPAKILNNPWKSVRQAGYVLGIRYRPPYPPTQDDHRAVSIRFMREGRMLCRSARHMMWVAAVRNDVLQKSQQDIAQNVLHAHTPGISPHLLEHLHEPGGRGRNELLWVRISRKRTVNPIDCGQQWSQQHRNPGLPANRRTVRNGRCEWMPGSAGLLLSILLFDSETSSLM